MNQSSKTGFTLVELLVVIAVISLLLAITVPIIGSVQNSAKTVKSLSNLRQLASAMQMYASDNKGLYPIGYHNPDPGHEIYWYLEIEQYIDQKTVSGNELDNILVSPFANENIAKGYYADGDVRTSPNTYSVHGVICPALPTNFTEDPRFPIWNIKENHSEIILIGEGNISQNGHSLAVFEMPTEWYGTASDPENPSDPEGFIKTYTSERKGALSYRANDHALVAFLDGHVEALKKGTVKFKNIIINR